MIYISRRAVFALMLSLISLLSSAVLRAQDSAESLDEYLPSGCHHSGQYQQQKVIAELSNPLETAGNFMYSCERGLIWHTATPITETAIYKMSGKHFLLTQSNELTPLEGRVHQSLGTLLNHLIGGDATYLKRHFHVATDADQLRLTPKNKRLKKFIQQISIRPENNKVAITLQHSVANFTHIIITDRQTHTGFDADVCRQLLPVNTLACDTLLSE